MKPSLPWIALLAALSLPLPATAGSVQFDYHGCNRPVTLTVDDANSLAVWRQLAGQAGFEVRAGSSIRQRNAHFSMTGPLYEVLSAFAKYTGAVLVASDDASCLGARQARTVWLMSEGTATASALMAPEDLAQPISVPAVAEPSARDANAAGVPDGAISLTTPQRRGQMTPAERITERERRRQARQEAQRGRRR